MISEIILPGVVGTALMTAVMYGVAYFTKDRFKVVKILGTILTFQTTPKKGLSDKPLAVSVGLIAHYLVGIGFTCAYDWLWSNGVVKEDFFNATWLGFVNGIIGVIGWRVFIAVHPNPPHLNLGDYLSAILFGHVFFAYGILLTRHIIS